MKRQREKDYKVSFIIALVIAAACVGYCIYRISIYSTASEYSKYERVVGKVTEATEASGKITKNKTGVIGATFTQSIKFTYEYEGKEYNKEDNNRKIKVNSSDVKGGTVYSDRYYKKGSSIELYVKGDKWMEVAKVKEDTDISYIILPIIGFVIAMVYALYCKSKSKKNAMLQGMQNGSYINNAYNAQNPSMNNGVGLNVNNNSFNNGYNNMNNGYNNNGYNNMNNGYNNNGYNNMNNGYNNMNNGYNNNGYNNMNNGYNNTNN